MLFNGFGGGCGNMPKDCGCGDNNCMWIILLLLFCNCGGGINGCVDIGTLIFLLLLLSVCDNNPCNSRQV